MAWFTPPRWLQRLAPGMATAEQVPEALWQQTLARYAFLGELSASDRAQLRQLTSEFLAHKEFTGAQGLEVSDAMAVAIAAQACLPVLHIGLRWYDDFKGIVVHAGAMVARRQVTDDSGVVHAYDEVLLGEAMHGGPVTLSWQEVDSADASAGRGFNVVVHEFVHKIDMRDGAADGCPPLSRAARTTWHGVMQPAFDDFCDRVSMAERFGAEPPWLDAYGATSPAEFFAVACEAYFVNRPRFTADFPALTELFDAFFRPAGQRAGRGLA